MFDDWTGKDGVGDKVLSVSVATSARRSTQLLGAGMGAPHVNTAGALLIGAILGLLVGAAATYALLHFIYIDTVAQMTWLASVERRAMVEYSRQGRQEELEELAFELLGADIESMEQFLADFVQPQTKDQLKSHLESTRRFVESSGAEGGVVNPPAPN